MFQAMLSIGDLIEGLGGPTAVADELGLTVSAVSNWRLRGNVSFERRIDMWRLAIEAGLDWRPDGFEGMAPPTPHRRQRERARA